MDGVSKDGLKGACEKAIEEGDSKYPVGLSYILAPKDPWARSSLFYLFFLHAKRSEIGGNKQQM